MNWIRRSWDSEPELWSFAIPMVIVVASTAGMIALMIWATS